ncbi:MAG TPA: DUF1801 domain-containing protein [Anaerolineales bacterium]|nr:DUF1801 domain-containing protein [Anaerolineales bacterium]
MSPTKKTQKPAKSIRKGKTSTGLSAEERAAMKETLRERKGAGEGENAVLTKIAAMAAPDRALAQRVHAIVKASAPGLVPKTWYGMPAYANKDGKVVCFFQDAAKFKARYATLGFSDTANLDEGAMWATSFALRKLTPTEEAKIAALVKKAVT